VSLLFQKSKEINMKDPKEILKLKITELGLATQTVNNLVDVVFNTLPEMNTSDPEQFTSIRHSTGKKHRRLMADFAKDIYIKEVLEAYENFPNYDFAGMYSDWTTKDSTLRHLQKKLAELGMTRFDWSLLRQSTTKGIKRSKDQWLDTPIGLLGTLSSPVSETLIRLNPHHEVTVQDLLELGPSFYYRMQNCRLSFFKTQEKLTSIGFKYEDGIIMQIRFSDWTPEQNIIEIMHRAKKSREAAIDFLKTAELLKFAPLGTYKILSIGK
jgi:hypothetical protein